MKKIFLATLIFALCFSCQKEEAVDLSKEKMKILELHHKQRDHHFKKDSIAFASQLSENFISVNRGEITQPQKAETISRYNRYFSAVEFVKWDDNAEPVIRFSDDGSLAYTIVDKTVIVTYKVCFTSCEVKAGFYFSDSAYMWGSDPGPDDKLFQVGGTNCYRATRECISRKYVRRVNNSLLNEDSGFLGLWGGDEVYAKACVKPVEPTGDCANSTIHHDSF